MKRLASLIACCAACLTLAASANTVSAPSIGNNVPNELPSETKHTAKYIKTRLQLIYALAFNSVETGRTSVSSYFFAEEFRSAYSTAKQLTPEGETGYYDFSSWLRTRDCKSPRAEIERVRDISATSAIADIKVFPNGDSQDGVCVMVRLRFEYGDWFIANFNNDLEGLQEYINRQK